MAITQLLDSTAGLLMTAHDRAPAECRQYTRSTHEVHTNTSHVLVCTSVVWSSADVWLLTVLSALQEGVHGTCMP